MYVLYEALIFNRASDSGIKNYIIFEGNLLKGNYVFLKGCMEMLIRLLKKLKKYWISVEGGFEKNV